MRAINAPIPSLLRAYKKALTPSSIPLLFPLPHAPRPAQLLAGVLQSAAVICSFRSPPTSNRHLDLPILFLVSSRSPKILPIFFLCSGEAAPWSSPATPQKPRRSAAAVHPGRRRCLHRLGRDAPPPQQSSPSAEAVGNPFSATLRAPAPSPRHSPVRSPLFLFLVQKC